VFVVLLVVALAVLAAAKKMEISIQDEGVFTSDDDGVRIKALNQAAALGATYVRQMVLMHMIHPCRGGEALRYLNALNRIVAEAKARGLKMQMVLTGVAANWGVPRGCAAPYTKPTGSKPSIKGWSAYVKKWVTYFAAKGVRRFSMWNEPNHPSFLCAGAVVAPKDGDVDHARCQAKEADNVKLYQKVYKAGWDAVQQLKKAKKVPKSVKVWIGEFAGHGLDFLTPLLKGKKFKADGFSYHPYQYCSPPATKKSNFPVATCKRKMGGISWIPDVAKALKAAAKKGSLRTPGKKTVPLFLTEFGYHRQGRNALPENVRAKWYPQALAFAKKNKVKGFTLYQIVPSPVRTPSLWDTSLLQPDLNASPSFRAIHAWAKKSGYKTKPFS